MRARRLLAALMASASVLTAGAAAMTVPQGESGVVRLRIVNDGDVPLNGVTAQWGDLPAWVRPSESSARVSAGVDGTASLFLSFDVHVAAPPERDVPLRFTLVDSEGTRWPRLVLLSVAESLRPDLTRVFPSYPNPFNPETWIPYQLSEASDVTVHIYDFHGTMVREIALGRQEAGWYTNRREAAYWDGRNRLGERVASGVYLYHLRAGAYSATGRLLVAK